MAYGRAGRHDDAVGAFWRATALEPEDMTASYSLAQGLSKLDLPEESKKALEDFIAHQRRRLESERVGGATELRSPSRFGAVDEPTAILERMAALEPYFAPVLYSEGFVLLREGENAQAIASFREAATRDPLSAIAYVFASGAYEEDGKL